MYRILWKLFKRLLVIVAILIVAGLVFLFIISPGKTTAIINDNGDVLENSVATIEKPLIDGVAQGIIIRGNNKNNPVLLFVHGGPGMPGFAWIKNELKGLEKLFTICYWEQRGAGMSYSKNISAQTMNLDQLVEDAAAVTRYLLKKFNKEKIYILGHSWGSFLSSFTIHKYPGLYHAYIGIGQVANTYLSEKESYEFVVSEAKKRNDKKALEKLAALKLPAINASAKEWWNYYKVERGHVFQYGGARYGRTVSINELRKAILFCREYTVMDKFNYARGLSFSQNHLGNALMKYDLNSVLKEQQIPVYIFQGIYDQQTSYAIAKNYFDTLKAPVKKFYTFYHSAHSPHIEEYAAFEKIVREDILGR